MYTDDTVIYSPISRIPTRTEVTTYQEDLNAVSDWCASNRMSINVKKTKTMTLGTMKKKQTVDIPFKINKTNITYTETYKYLGLLWNKQLTLKEHVHSMTGVIATKIKTLPILRSIINSTTSLLIYKTLILPLFEYDNLTFTMVPKALTQKLQRLQNCALKVVYCREYGITPQESHYRARLLPLAQRADQQLLCLMYKRSYNTIKYPHVVQNLDLVTRSRSKTKFDVPRPNYEKFKQFPLYHGSVLWDTLPYSTQNADSYSVYKNKLKKYLWEKSYPP